MTGYPQLALGPIGACEVVWKYGESDALYLGEFAPAGVKLTQDTKIAEVKTAQGGDVAVDGAFIGSPMTLEMDLTRPQYDVLNEILLADGIQVSGDHYYIKIKNHSGCYLYDLCRRLVIKPICDNVVSIDPAEWTEIFKCYPIPAMNLVFDASTQRTFPVKWVIFPSQDSGYVGEFGTLGMPSGSTEFGL
jgi:hypothetical protein